jgi:hypothetical protein
LQTVAAAIKEPSGVQRFRAAGCDVRIIYRLHEQCRAAERTRMFAR